MMQTLTRERSLQTIGTSENADAAEQLDVALHVLLPGQEHVYFAGTDANGVHVVVGSGSNWTLAADVLHYYNEIADFEFGNDVVVVLTQEENNANGNISGDIYFLGFEDGVSSNAPIQTGNDIIIVQGPRGTAVGDCLYIDILEGAPRSAAFFGGNDVLFDGFGSTELAGDVRTSLVFLSGQNQVIEFRYGHDRLFGGQESAGDVLSHIGFDESNGHGLFNTATYFFGNDFLASGVTMIGDAGNFSIYVEWLGNAQKAFFGHDTIVGGAVSELLIGDTEFLDIRGGGIAVFGDDILISGSADETLVGDGRFVDLWYDLVTGSATVIRGADTFIFSGNFGSDLIQDFDDGLDRVIFEGFDPALLHLVGYEVDNDSGDMMVDLTELGGGTVTLAGVGEIAMSNFEFI